MSEAKCPICNKVANDVVAAPFCSSRCRKIDLGQWLSGRYRIAGEKNVDETTASSTSASGTNED